MKKVGIVNFQYSNHNYGAVLQAAALNEYINKNLGISAEHINYIPELKAKGVIKRGKKLLKTLMLEAGLLKSDKLDHEKILNKKAFEEFRMLWLPRTNTVYTTLDELKDQSFTYSHVIVGSDQVWRPSYTGSESLVYFLDFLNDDVRKIAYAASFGTDNWRLDQINTAIIREKANEFSAVSVRESTGVKLCDEVFGIKAQHVLDPTLLVGRGFFDRVCGTDKGAQSSGIVYYKLDKSDDFLSLLASCEQQLGFQSKDIYFDKSDGRTAYHNVDDWLSYIRNSEFVITDSYHCVCFALLFEKPFLCYPNSTRGLTRIHSLLELLGLEKHFYNGDNDSLDIKSELMDVDYNAVRVRIKELRKTSAEFIAKALESK